MARVDGNMTLYVVEMLRWGDRECHSYILGVYSTREQAKLAGQSEEYARAGKYEYCLNIRELDLQPTWEEDGSEV